jgi:hypothetical protein
LGYAQTGLQKAIIFFQRTATIKGPFQGNDISLSGIKSRVLLGSFQERQAWL